jgi:hypothetical protein
MLHTLKTPCVESNILHVLRQVSVNIIHSAASTTPTPHKQALALPQGKGTLKMSKCLRCGCWRCGAPLVLRRNASRKHVPLEASRFGGVRASSTLWRCLLPAAFVAVTQTNLLAHECSPNIGFSRAAFISRRPTLTSSEVQPMSQTCQVTHSTLDKHTRRAHNCPKKYQATKIHSNTHSLCIDYQQRPR